MILNKIVHEMIFFISLSISQCKIHKISYFISFHGNEMIDEMIFYFVMLTKWLILFFRCVNAIVNEGNFFRVRLSVLTPLSAENGLVDNLTALLPFNSS
jgi:hypothetical protein